MKKNLIFTLKVVVAHVITYLIAGIISSKLNDYSSLFQEPIISNFMRPFNSEIVMFAPILQIFRGIIYAIFLYPFMSFFQSKKIGWIYMWSIFVFVGIIGTPAAAPGSMEGLIFTQLPLRFHFIGYPEMLLQTLVFCIWVFYWEKGKKQHQSELSPNKN
jgi:hypothetical protein